MAKKLIPWTYETAPLGAYVRRKGDCHQAWLLNTLMTAGAWVGQTLFVHYEKLLEDFLTIDDKPCGTEIEVPDEPLKVGDRVRVLGGNEEWSVVSLFRHEGYDCATIYSDAYGTYSVYSVEYLKRAKANG